MGSSAEELLIIARLKNEISRPLKQITADQHALTREITTAGVATKAQSVEMRRLQKEYDFTSRRIGLMGQKLSDVGSRMTRRFTLPVVAGLGLATKAALDDAKGQAVLANTMRNTEHATSGQVKALETWIRKTQFASGVSDSDLRPALGKLLLAHRTVEQAQSDVNIAMDVSVAKNKDLTAVIDAFAKAANGQTQGLRRLGVQTTDAAGRALSYDQILQRLAKTTAGSWKTAAETDAGQLQRNSEQIKEFVEDVGTKMIPTVVQGGKALTGFLDVVNSFGAAGQSFVVFGGLALAAVGPVARITGGIIKLTQAYKAWAIARGVSQLALPFGPSVVPELGLPAAAGGGLLGTLAAATAVVAPFAIAAQVVTSHRDADRRSKAAAKTAKLLGPGGLPGASYADRAQGLATARAELERLRRVRLANLKKLGISPSFYGDDFGYENPQQREQVADLEKKIKLTQRAQDNVTRLSTEMHRSRSEVERLAAGNVDLSGSYAKVKRDMDAVTAAAKANGTAISDQAAAYDELKKAVSAGSTGRERFLDRFLNEKQEGLSFADSMDAYKKAKSPREKQAAELALFRQGVSYLEAGELAGRYGPKGLSQPGFAANLQELLKPVLRGEDPAGLASIAQQFLSKASSEDPTGARSLQAARNQFEITQIFNGKADPDLVKEAAHQGYDAASKAKQHADDLAMRF